MVWTMQRRQTVYSWRESNPDSVVIRPVVYSLYWTRYHGSFDSEK